MSLTSNSHIFERIQGASNLPSLPQVLLQILAACDDEAKTAKELSLITSRDPSISAKVLRLLNSPFIGLTQRINSLEKAVIYLGVDTIKNLAISASVLEAFSQTRMEGGLNMPRFWWHSFMTATLARRLAVESGYQSPDEAFLAGLLHDIGRLLLAANFPKEYSRILQQSEAGPDLTMLEQQVLGVTHAEVGAWLVRKWKLHSFLADSILYHHQKPARIVDAFKLLQIVHVANCLAHEDAAEYQRGVQTAESILKISSQKLNLLTAGAREEVDGVAVSMDISVSAPEEVTPKDNQKQVQKRKELITEVKSSSLLYGTLQSLLRAESKSSAIAAVERGLGVLFDADLALFFLHEKENDLLVCHGSHGKWYEDLVSGLAISMASEKNLLVQCLNNRAVVDSFSLVYSDVTIADEQIIRLLGCEGLVCIPMRAHRENVGVIVLGVDQAQYQKLIAQKRVLTMLAGHAAIALYVDDMKRRQAKRIEEERREASTMIARRITHEVNNPLSIIKNYIRVLRQKLPEADGVQDELRIVGEELDRVADLVRQLSAFSGPQMGLREPLDLNGLINDLIKIIKKSILPPSSYETHLSLDPKLPNVVTDKNSLVQVLLNLIKNAAEAMPEGGNIYIETKFVDAFGRRLIGEDNGDSGGVRIMVRDDGPGIPPAVRVRLFEPSNTTKDESHYGLGLSIVHSLLKELGGGIECSSDEGKGTQFEITLPIGN